MLKSPKMLLAAIAVLGAIGFSACEKLKTEGPVSGFEYDTNSQINYSNIKNHDISGYRGGSGCGEILVFDDMETFKHALSELERQVEEYDDAFVAYYSDMNEEELFEKEQEINYSEYKPMTDFENYLDFHSSNADYLIAEAQYLDGDMNEEDDPELLFIGDEEERSLLNACNEVMVNDTIYKLTEDGYFVISDGNFRMLEQLDDFDNLPENVSFIGGDNSSSMRMEECKTKYFDSDRKFNDPSTRKIEWYLKKGNNFFGSYLTAKTKNFKKRSNGRFKKYRTLTKVNVSGVTYESCDSSAEVAPEAATKKKKRRSVKRKIRVDSDSYIKSGSIKGYHYGANGIEHHSILTW